MMLAMLLSLGACSGEQPATGNSREPLYYRNPMDPAVTSPVPAKDSMGMDYVPVYAGSSAPSGVSLTPAQTRRIGLRMEAVRRAPWVTEVRTSGVVQADSRFTAEYNVRAEAWIESIAVRTGEVVKAGQLLFEVFSPRLEASIEEYRSTLQFGDPARITQSERRLRQLGFEEPFIAMIKETRRLPDRIAYHASGAGVVTEVDVASGQYVTLDKPVLKLARLDEVWIMAALPPSRRAEVPVGSEARIESPGGSHASIMGRVESFVAAVDERSRSITARVRVPNRDLSLVPGMLVGVTLRSPVTERALQVPMEAIISDGAVTHVFVAARDGTLIPRQVLTGAEADGRVVIRDGLAEGETVVTNGVFLLDAESNLRERLRGSSTSSPAPNAVAESSERH